MAKTQYYVDPSIAASSGTGTTGDPYGDLQYALDTITRDATNGDQINVKAGTAEILSATLSWTSYGTPSSTASLLISGYTSAADDGGIGEIDANNFKVSSGKNYVHWKHMKVGGSGTEALITSAQQSYYYMCEFHGSSNSSAISSGTFLNCYFHSFTGTSRIITGQNGRCVGCYFDGGTTPYSLGVVYIATANYDFIGNVVKLNNTTATGIRTQAACSVIGNSFYNAAAGTASGIYLTATALVVNNIIEGWSGAGGEAIRADSSPVGGLGYLYNGYYNNTNNGVITGVYTTGMEVGNFTSAASMFTDPSTNDFSVTTEAKEKAMGQTMGPSGSTANFLDVGAAQREESGGGGGGAVTTRYGHA